MQLTVNYAQQFKRLGDRLALRADHGGGAARPGARPPVRRRGGRARAGGTQPRAGQASDHDDLPGPQPGGRHPRKRARFGLVRHQRDRRIRRPRPSLHEAKQPGAAKLRGHPARAARARAARRGRSGPVHHPSETGRPAPATFQPAAAGRGWNQAHGDRLRRGAVRRPLGTRRARVPSELPGAAQRLRRPGTPGRGAHHRDRRVEVGAPARVDHDRAGAGPRS
jgi:hypothetical protein